MINLKNEISLPNLNNDYNLLCLYNNELYYNNTLISSNVTNEDITESSLTITLSDNLINFLNYYGNASNANNIIQIYLDVSNNTGVKNFTIYNGQEGKILKFNYKINDRYITVPLVFGNSIMINALNHTIQVIPNFKIINRYLDFKKIFCGVYHSYGVTDSGKVFSWGYNNGGQLMDGTLVDKNTPVAVCLNNLNIIQVSERLALTSEGVIYQPVSSSPYLPAILSANNMSFIKIAGSPIILPILGLTAAGLVYAWGTNTYGELGDNSTTSRSTPVAVCMNSLTFIEIQYGNNSSYGLTALGQAYAWGNNGYGQLGDNTQINKSTPVAVCMNGLSFCQMSCSGFQNLGLTSTGQVYSWGSNTYGELGDNTIINKSTPVAVCMNGLSFCRVFAGVYNGSSYGLTSLGQAYAWGYNSQGQLGDNTITSKLTPVAVCMNGLTFCDISAGQAHALALTPEGRSYAWGGSGALGDGTIISKRTPVAVCY